MNQATNVIDFQEAKSQVKPALITGGPTGPEDWLKQLDRGTVFLALPKNSKDLILNKYMLWEHKTQSTNLLWATPDGKQIDVWVPTLRFCREFVLHEVIGQVILPTEEADHEMETSNSGRTETPEGTA